MSCVLGTAQTHTSCSQHPTAQTRHFKTLSFLQSNFQVSSPAMYVSLSSNISFKADTSGAA